MIAACLLAAILGGLGRRLAGGAAGQWFGIDVGDLPVRIAFGVLIAISGALGSAYGHPFIIAGWVFPAWCQAAAVAFGVWVGSTMPMFSAIDLGKNEGTVPQDLAGLTTHGMLGVLLPAALAWWGGYSWEWLLASGLASAPAYWIGWTISGDRGRPDFPIGLRGGTELGELLWGAAFGVGMFLAFA